MDILYSQFRHFFFLPKKLIFANRHVNRFVDNQEHKRGNPT